MKKAFRIGVVAVVKNTKDEYLLCERGNRPGVWQFPQGGIDAGETPEETLFREVAEEIGITEGLSIIKKAERLTTYIFPENFSAPIAQKYCGQKHHWFLVQIEEGVAPRLDLADGEFRDFRWVDFKVEPPVFVDWKQAAYQDGLHQLGVPYP